ncbi:hypothetical protein E4U14_007666 [Claviceps sp. LM454 group G7]|nr:hypothetical protein E4U14_007666 [Claviceps sp. LM454 group G7]
MACTDDVEIYAAKQQSVVRSWTHLIVRAIEGRKTDAPTGHVGDGAQGWLIVGVRHSEGQLIKVANPRVASSAE